MEIFSTLADAPTTLAAHTAAVERADYYYFRGILTADEWLDDRKNLQANMERLTATGAWSPADAEEAAFWMSVNAAEAIDAAAFVEMVIRVTLEHEDALRVAGK